MNKLMPFHEAIIEMINRGSDENISFVLELLKITAIPKGHDEIIAAIEDKWGALAFWQIPIAEMKVHIFSQKQAAKEKAEDNKQNIDLEALLLQCKTLLSLLESLSPGTTRTNLLDEHLEKMYELTKSALGK
ncbi:MAG: hypothetical protein V1928_02100 [Parcubacteria group bacterium]